MCKYLALFFVCGSTLAMERGPVHSYPTEAALYDRLQTHDFTLIEFFEYVKCNTPHKAICELFETDTNKHWIYFTPTQLCRAYFYQIYRALHNSQTCTESGDQLAVVMEKTAQTLDGIWTRALQQMAEASKAASTAER